MVLSLQRAKQAGLAGETFLFLVYIKKYVLVVIIPIFRQTC